MLNSESCVIFVCNSKIRFRAPYEVKQGRKQLHYTYLDTFGRPVVIANKKNLVEQHIQDFEVVISLILLK